MTPRAPTLTMLLAALCGCTSDEDRTLPPPGQILLYVDTDAPLPAAPGATLASDEPASLFDRVRIEVFRPGEDSPCTDCTNEFDLDRSLVAGKRASVGIVTTPHLEGHRARVRLFRRDAVTGKEPRPDATIDVTALLPATDEEGIKPVTVSLRVEDLAKKIGSLADPVPVVAGAPTGMPLWDGAIRVACAGAPRANEVCIPGGAAWMGHPSTRVYHEPGDEQLMRIVVLPPFYLDATEVTVEKLREAAVASADDPMRYSPNDGQPGPSLHCTYTDALGGDEALPVNCISWAKAREYCQKQDADLPTEAQYQYAAGALEGRLFPWGEDEPACPDAVYSRSPYTSNPDRVCPGAWVTPPANGLRDRVVRPEGTLFDLAGNVAEWAFDQWNLQTESCWGTGVFRDPVCTKPSEDPAGKGLHTIVGGSYVDVAGDLVAARRRPGYSFARALAAGPAGGLQATIVTSVGFRCTRPATR